MRKKICFCLALVMLLSSMSMFVGAVDFTGFVTESGELGVVEQKVLSTATVEEEFADNHVLVVLSNKASLNFKSYSASDFKEVKCESVQDLSTGKRKKVEEKVANYKNAVSTLSAESKAAAVEEINKYNQILCLELAEKGKENVLKAIKALEARDDVIYAGPDYVMELCSTTAEDTYRDDQWAIGNIHLDGAWDLASNISGVVVGVIDSGIDASHPDLQGKIATALCADFTQTYVQYTVPSDYTGHGTHVAGIIAATKDNGRGIAGAASGVQIAAFRVFNANGRAFSSKVALAIDYAEEMGLQILNFSGSWVYDPSDDESTYDYCLESIIENFSGLFICAAGNDTRNLDLGYVYPACFDLSNLLVVGASTENRRRYDDSNYGTTFVDVFAPGEDILSCFPTNKCPGNTCSSTLHYAYGYHYDSGTSMAAPYVAGIAALMLSENSSLTTQQIKDRIIATCTDYPALDDLCVSDGIVNACHAVLSVYSSSTMTADSSRSVSLSAGQEYWIEFTAPSSGIYSFFTTGSRHTVGELYSITSGLVERSSNANSSTSSNFYIEKSLSQEDVVYLKVTLKSATASGNFTLYITA